MRSIHIFGAGGGGGGEKPQLARQKEELNNMTIITRLACCTGKTEVACRTRAADITVIVFECIVGRVGASKLDEGFYSSPDSGHTKSLW